MGVRGKDLTGQVFGKLTVIEQAENPTTHRGNYWLCSCECGGEKVILGSYLRRGITRSCGCQNKPVLTGQVFGLLTVKGPATSVNKGGQYWLCECVCGQIRTIISSQLTRSNGTTHCGCKGEVGIVGQTFDMLTVTGPAPRSEVCRHRWRCVCECGEVVDKTTSQLKNSDGFLNCGCNPKPKGHGFNNYVKQRFGNLIGQRFGILTVLEQGTSVKGRTGRDWICQCECGNTKVVTTASLNRGVSSCGCLHNPDLTGRRFGKLTVIESIKSTRTVSRKWKTVCDCGQVKLVRGALLLDKKVKSCGCDSKVDLTGQRFTELIVLEPDPGRGGVYWKCRCDCGNLSSTTTSMLLRKKSKRCGPCGRKLGREKATTHGMTKTVIYNRWKGMISRCYQPKDPSYHNYGGRGITVCDRWRESFENFYEDMGDPPPNHTLDREDNNGPYSPDNCKWATLKEQGRNTRNTVWVEYRGERVKRIELSERFGLPGRLLEARLDAGWDIDLAVTPPTPKGLKWGKVAVLNLKTRCIELATGIKSLKHLNATYSQMRSATHYRMVIDNTWLAKSLEDPTPWNDFRGCTGVSEDVILKQPNEPHVIFSNVREAYRHLERHSLLDKEYTLKVFE